MAFVQTVYADCALPPKNPVSKMRLKYVGDNPYLYTAPPTLGTPTWGYRGFNIPLNPCYIYTYKALWLYCG